MSVVLAVYGSLMKNCIEAAADIDTSVNKTIYGELITGGQL
jgi:hypothetical protein